MSFRLRYAARSDVGLLREGNEDSAYAGPRLLAVADGMGGHAHGEVASAGAIATLAPLDTAESGVDPGDAFGGGDFADALAQAVRAANDKLRQMVESDPTLEGMGTTLTAILWAGHQLAIVHVGDSRAYLLRDGELFRITRDHTLVQSLIDEGRIDEDEAAVHPQRSLLLRALDGRGDVEPDLTVRDVRSGDRYLLCSDGLSGVVSEDTLREALRSGSDPERVVVQLIELANRGGGPDNITCVVADVVDTEEWAGSPVVAGAAANVERERAREQDDDTITMDTSAGRAAALMRNPEDSGERAPQPAGPDVGGRGRRRWPRRLVSLVVLAGLLVGVGYGGLSYARSQYYVGARDGEVVIFRGLSQQVAGRNLSRVYSHTGLAVSRLPAFQRQVVAGNMPAESLGDAHTIVQRLRSAAQACEQDQQQQEQQQQDGQAGGKRGERRGNQGGSSPAPETPRPGTSPSPSVECPEGVSVASD